MTADNMRNTNVYHIEVADRLATIYLIGRIQVDALADLIAVCDAMPPAVRTLCIALNDLRDVGDNVPTIIHDLRRHWQASRYGTFRVAFGHDRGESVSAEVTYAP
jgi:hypothetical protein